MVKIAEHDYLILDDLSALEQYNGRSISKKIEKIARKCYKSEGLISDNSDLFLNAKLKKNEHFAMIEHGHKISVCFLTDRGIGNELIRQRLTDFDQFGQGFGWDFNISYAERSTRYCNFSAEKFGSEITVVRSCETPYESEDFRDWLDGCRKDEEIYMRRIAKGVKPQIARGNLPLTLQTEIVMTTNLTEWLHILDLRCGKPAHPDMRRIMLRLLSDFHTQIPIFFDDLYNEYKEESLSAIAEYHSIQQYLAEIQCG